MMKLLYSRTICPKCEWKNALVAQVCVCLIVLSLSTSFQLYHKDFSTYIYESHKRTRSQCQKECIFLNFDEKFPNLRKKFPKLDKLTELYKSKDSSKYAPHQKSKIPNFEQHVAIFLSASGTRPVPKRVIKIPVSQCCLGVAGSSVLPRPPDTWHNVILNSFTNMR